MVDRYTFVGLSVDLKGDKDGEWVRYDDYEKLLRKKKSLKKKVRELEDEIYKDCVDTSTIGGE